MTKWWYPRCCLIFTKLTCCTRVHSRELPRGLEKGPPLPSSGPRGRHNGKLTATVQGHEKRVYAGKAALLRPIFFDKRPCKISVGARRGQFSLPPDGRRGKIALEGRISPSRIPPPVGSAGKLTRGSFFSPGRGPKSVPLPLPESRAGHPRETGSKTPARPLFDEIPPGTPPGIVVKLPRAATDFPGFCCDRGCPSGNLSMGFPEGLFSGVHAGRSARGVQVTPRAFPFSVTCFSNRLLAEPVPPPRREFANGLLTDC